jgi:hypothetical protein
MGFRIEVSPDRKTVTLHAIDRFDIAPGFAFW